MSWLDGGIVLCIEYRVQSTQSTQCTEYRVHSTQSTEYRVHKVQSTEYTVYRVQSTQLQNTQCTEQWRRKHIMAGPARPRTRNYV